MIDPDIRPTLLGIWTAPSGEPVEIYGRMGLELELCHGAAGRPPLPRDDRRWLIEEILPQLRAPLQAMVEAHVNALSISWAAPPPADEALP
jgi:hypothetical protein